MRIILTILAVVTNLISIIAVAVVAVLNFRPLYYLDIRMLHISEKSGLSEALLKENYDILIDYNSMFNHGVLDFKEIGMSCAGRVHFQEVKDIFVLFQEMGLIAIVISIITAVILVKKYRSYGFLRASALTTVIIPMTAGGFVAVNWNKAFVLFHKLAFDNDYWLFDPKTDPIIKALPDEFFMHCAVMIIAMVLVMCVILELIYRKTMKGKICINRLEKMKK